MSRLNNVNTCSSNFLLHLKIFSAVVEAGGAQGGAAAKIKAGAQKGLKVAEAGGKKLMDDFKSISAEVSGIFLYRHLTVYYIPYIL